MSPVKCPTCDVIIPANEVADGWCENCGKKIPRFALKVNEPTSVTTSASAASASSSSPKVSGRGYAIMIAFIVVGAIAVTIMRGGKGDLVWLGCGIGAGLGVAVAQMTGNWVKRAAA